MFYFKRLVYDISGSAWDFKCTQITPAPKDYRNTPRRRCYSLISLCRRGRGCKHILRGADATPCPPQDTPGKQAGRRHGDETQRLVPSWGTMVTWVTQDIPLLGIQRCDPGGTLGNDMQSRDCRGACLSTCWESTKEVTDMHQTFQTDSQKSEET